MTVLGNASEHLLHIGRAMNPGQVFDRRQWGLAPFQSGEGRSLERLENRSQTGRAFRVAKAGVMFQTNRVGIEQSGH